MRLFRGEFGVEISWLLPAAVILLGAGIWLTWRSRRTDRVRAALILWGGWLLVTGATFSFMQGIIHPYYTAALAPAIGALVGIGGVLLWQRRRPAGRAANLVLAGVVVVTCAWDVTLLLSQSFPLWVAVAAIAASVLAVLALGPAMLRTGAGRRLVGGAALVTMLALAVPATAWGAATAATPHSGSIPTAVATSSSAGFGGGGGFGGNGAAGSPGSLAGPGRAAGGGTAAEGRPTGTAGAAPGQSGTGLPEGASAPSGTRTSGSGATDRGFGGGGGVSGVSGVGVSSALTAALEKTTTRWAAATDGSQSAASLELATAGKAVMAIGGFTGSDPAPTLAQFKAYVAAGDITYYIAGGQGGGPGGGSDAASEITAAGRDLFGFPDLRATFPARRLRFIQCKISGIRSFTRSATSSRLATGLTAVITRPRS